MQEPEILSELREMSNDDSYRTEPGYSIDAEAYPDHIVPFEEFHINYLRKHAQIDPVHYLSNLRLMLKIR